MTTSITDARYNVLHHTPSYTSSLLFDEPPETGWSVMPGFDETLNIPIELEPPRFDADETLPNQIHPSYPYGRPVSLGKKSGGSKGKGVGNLLGTIGMGMSMDLRGGEWSGGSGRVGGQWQEWGLDEVRGSGEGGRREIPPGMAGAKRPPSPPSPSLHPSATPPPRSMHLRRLIERQQASPSIPNEGFDAPVPNETYDEPNSPQQQQQQQPVEQTRNGRNVVIGGGGSERENEDEGREESIMEGDEE
ncbi:hypothetical protein I302_106604 [Kwoniella bestiolae CBS 10118]|uniref:Anaphase-promoting complex subunit 13 n=1 Tax=Kwoniella bestiolae CBS 10118 TaxID=1296100 RepID=A0A1B9G0X1_9TREE|nr:hypothetical protein I302_06135 [Kwoniella bestiolae CBS 10118]OCF24674.1 hypothetical protein I302_06135 [Kwoniella bestiolae CBS 10118]